MLGSVHHVGYVAKNRGDGVAVFVDQFGLALVSEFELPEYRLAGAFLGSVDGLVEVVEFTDDELAAARLCGQALRLDHVAHEVQDIETAAARLIDHGWRLCGPDGSPLRAPVLIAGSLHVWLDARTLPSVRLQLVQQSR
jgi:catechol 2,3-dioxygenase-like lactoylglutathione lyase family enzyme